MSGILGDRWHVVDRGGEGGGGGDGGGGGGGGGGVGSDRALRLWRRMVIDALLVMRKSVGKFLKHDGYKTLE